MNDNGDTDDADNESTDDEPLLVEVFVVGGSIEIDSRTGLPWGMTQEEFDQRNAEFQKQKKAGGIKGEGSASSCSPARPLDWEAVHGKRTRPDETAKGEGS